MSVSTKALWQGSVCAAKQPVWLQQSDDGRVVGAEARDLTRDQITQNLVGRCRDLGFLFL